MSNDKKKKPDDFDLESLFKGLSDMLSGGMSDEAADPSNDEVDDDGKLVFRPANDGGVMYGGFEEQAGLAHNQREFDVTEAFDKQIKPAIEKIEVICNRAGMPFQMAFEVKGSGDMVVRRHYLGDTVQTPETQTAWMMYHLPHAASHLLLMASAVPIPFPQDNPPLLFDHVRVFDNEVVPVLSPVLITLHLLNVAFQMGFIVKSAPDHYEPRVVVPSNWPELSCEIKAAFRCYSAHSMVKTDIANLYQDWVEVGDDEDEGQLGPEY